MLSKHGVEEGRSELSEQLSMFARITKLNVSLFCTRSNGNKSGAMSPSCQKTMCSQDRPPSRSYFARHRGATVSAIAKQKGQCGNPSVAKLSHDNVIANLFNGRCVGGCVTKAAFRGPHTTNIPSFPAILCDEEMGRNS